MPEELYSIGVHGGAFEYVTLIRWLYFNLVSAILCSVEILDNFHIDTPYLACQLLVYYCLSLCGRVNTVMYTYLN